MVPSSAKALDMSLPELIQAIFEILRQEGFYIFNFPPGLQFFDGEKDISVVGSIPPEIVQEEQEYIRLFEQEESSVSNQFSCAYWLYNEKNRAKVPQLMQIYDHYITWKTTMKEGGKPFPAQAEILLPFYECYDELSVLLTELSYLLSAGKKLQCTMAAKLVAYLLLRQKPDLTVLLVRISPNSQKKQGGLVHAFLLVFERPLPANFDIYKYNSWPKDGFVVDYWNKDEQGRSGFMGKISDLISPTRPLPPLYNHYKKTYLWKVYPLTFHFENLVPMPQGEGFIEQIRNFSREFFPGLLAHLCQQVPSFKAIDDLGVKVKQLSSPASVAGCANASCSNASAGAALKKCPACKSTSYCSPACQQADWSKHKLVCMVRCATCSTVSVIAAMQKCTACNSVYYCNAACQQTDWEKHKLVCKVRCATCSTASAIVAMQKCTACNSVYYCNAACQQTDLPRHEAKCKKPGAKK